MGGSNSSSKDRFDIFYCSVMSKYSCWAEPGYCSTYLNVSIANFYDSLLIDA